VEVDLNSIEQEVEVQFYGTNSPFVIYLPTYYKLRHGEDVQLKISKEASNGEWTAC
jgi:hypothetical protein